MSPVTKTVELEVAKRFCDLHFFLFGRQRSFNVVYRKGGREKKMKPLSSSPPFLKAGGGGGKKMEKIVTSGCP